MLFLVTLILGGEKVRGERVIKVLNPATEEVVGEVWEAGREETRRAVDLALESFQIFSRLSIKDRAKVLVRASDGSWPQGARRSRDCSPRSRGSP